MPAKQPYFIFPAIPAYEELSFEKLTAENFQQLYLMFEADKNPFTNERFKHYEQAREYAEYLEQHGACSTKHSGQDWLFLWKDANAGILHLYDLSLETLEENNRRCWVGFATKPLMRNKGITKKAVQYFVRYIFENYTSIKYVHSMTLKENFAAQGLLKAAGFEVDEAERLGKEYKFYIQER